MLFLTLKVQIKLFEEVFDCHFLAKAETLGHKGKFDAGSGKTFRQFDHLLLQTLKEVLIDGNNPIFKSEWCVFIEEDNLILVLDYLFQVDEVFMTCHLEKMNHAFDNFPLFRTGDFQCLFDEGVSFFVKNFSQLSKGILFGHGYQEFLRHCEKSNKIIINLVIKPIMYPISSEKD